MTTKLIDSKLPTIKNYVVKSTEKEWKPLIENGIHYKGIFVKSLKYDEQKRRSTTIQLKFEAGASYPYHNHPGGEEVYVLDGACTFEDAEMVKGDFLYTPPNCKHAVKSETGCVLLLMVPEEVEILS